MITSLGVISHITAVLSFLLLAVLIVSKYLRRKVDRAILLATVISLVWAGSVVTQVVWGQPGFFPRYLLELLRDAAWIGVLLVLLIDGERTVHSSDRTPPVLKIIAATVAICLLSFALLEYAFEFSVLNGKVKVAGQIALALLGLSLVEQIWRNSINFNRSSLRYLCIGIATLMAYDFFMYTDALLFGQVSDAFWGARGFVNALIVPLFAVNMINTRKQPVHFQLSRNAIFHAGTLIFAGIYLLFLAAGSYYVRVMGGEWGEALQVLLITISMAFFITLITSRRVRSRLMVFISRHFFDYKYDYREEWLKLTRELADLGDAPPLPERVISILSGLVEGNAGALWVKDETGHYQLQSAINLSLPKHTGIDCQSELIQFFLEREWVVDLHEYRRDPTRYNLMEIPDAILHTPDGWLIIPLYLDNSLYGLALIGNPYAKVELNWENFDLIRVVARQICNLLAHADSQSMLSRAMQFEAVSRASAFMVHDLKTLIAQLSLLTRNAAKHRHNPAFIDDMIETTDHAVRKMSNLIDHIRNPVDDPPNTETVDINVIARNLVEHYAWKKPAPRLIETAEPILIRADPDQLKSVLGHLVQNAQDATPPDGEVSLSMKMSAGYVVLFIQDTGSGMTEEFIKQSLFQPFQSTKGLTGMGIGAYQAREYVRRLGGNIDVTSKPEVGSCFSVRLPLATRQTPATEPANVAYSNSQN
ncbi:XrtA/PEP-CTERM system histidine kinase PrsK [Marinobacter sp. X15-166B]|uniref:XrtA/PEP-CTERM system histidine kinase PrsK n=1 Tax=Marinobacter sp. X15-166B TaxID=1897620 RepID=UPI00085CADCA|nr:XrtA/PEP-CTERM system histidine kinase PrsK [Marinobacter sp. X15-166B]OEY67739.1 histidine kinase [Marinobacter sp. X15-166B]